MSYLVALELHHTRESYAIGSRAGLAALRPPPQRKCFKMHSCSSTARPYVRGTSICTLAPVLSAHGALPIASPLGTRPDEMIMVANRDDPRHCCWRCTLVVVYPPDCALSLRAAKQWTQDVLRSRDTVALPPTWRVMWLSSTDSLGSVGALPSRLPFLRVYTTRRDRIESALGIQAFPTEIALDRGGRVVAEELGGVLRRKTDYRPDCSIARADSVRAGTRLTVPISELRGTKQGFGGQP